MKNKVTNKKIMMLERSSNPEPNNGRAFTNINKLAEIALMFHRTAITLGLGGKSQVVL